MILRNRVSQMKKALQRGPVLSRWTFHAQQCYVPQLVECEQFDRSSSTSNFPVLAILALVERGLK